MRAFHALSIEKTLEELKAKRKDGLSSLDASARLKTHGPNILTEEEALHWFHILFRQFTNFLILILLVAAILSWFLGDIIDAFAILAIVVLNGVLGFVQEWKAETALKNLKKMLKPHCRVIRDGRMQDIDASLLVQGDIVLLDSGDSVPADMRLIDSVNLKADESALTGESIPVDKNTQAVPEDAHITSRNCMVWMGTHIVNGRAQGIVTATGMNTEFGRIADLTGKIQETETRLQRQLSVLAKQLTLLVAIVIAAIILIGWLGGQPLLQMLMAGIALAVSAIPEGLPAVVTITLALGVRSMARHKALLRHLQTAETLGATSVICTDKTGTLTKNEMTIQKLWLGSGEVSISGVGYEPEGQFSQNGNTINPPENPDLRALLNTGVVCNHARVTRTETGWRAIGSPTEAAFVTAAQKAGIEDGHGQIFCEFSFNSSRKRMSVIEKCPDTMCVHVKGAPEVLLARADKILIDGKEQKLDEAMKQKIEQAYHGFAQEGLRTLALALKKLPLSDDINEDHAETGLVFLGVAGIIDPPRPEAKESIEKTKKAGIRVIMITGDSPDTALAVAQQIGLASDKAITGSELGKISDEALLTLLDEDVIFARTVPEDKYRIVKILQSKNQLVAMTGDGVNDAPALKQADIGIAMGIRGTDVAKGASDLVLSDDNFATIVNAIEEGRRQYANIRKFVRYLTSSNVGETIAVFINILLGWPLILLPIQILWINLVTDSVTALSLSVEKAESNVMDEPPRSLDQPILDKDGFIMLGLFGAYIGLSSLALFGLYLDTSYALANSVSFTALVLLSNILVLNFRSFERPLHKIGWFSNPWLIAAVFSMITLQIAAVYLPFLQNILNTTALGLNEWLLIIAVSVPIILVSEANKIYKAQIAV